MEYNILPDDFSNNLEDLESWYNDFMGMTYYQRKMSNDMSIQRYGEDNISRYNKMKSDLLHNDTDYVDSPDLLDADNQSSNITYTSESVNDELESIKLRIKDAESQGLILMYDFIDYGGLKDETGSDISNTSIEIIINQYQRKWEAFNSLPQNKRVLSNQMAESIFGMDNYNLYNSIIAHYNSKIIVGNDTPIHHPSYSNAYSYLNGKEITDDINNVQTYYSSGEMDTKSSDPLVNENGEIANKYLWVSKLEKLSSLLENCTNKDRRNALKEQIHRLWWNPEIPFSTESAKNTYLRKE